MAQKVQYQTGNTYDNHQGIIDISVEPSPKFTCVSHTNIAFSRGYIKYYRDIHYRKHS